MELSLNHMPQTKCLAASEPGDGLLSPSHFLLRKQSYQEVAQGPRPACNTLRSVWEWDFRAASPALPNAAKRFLSVPCLPFNLSILLASRTLLNACPQNTPHEMFSAYVQMRPGSSSQIWLSRARALGLLFRLAPHTFSPHPKRGQLGYVRDARASACLRTGDGDFSPCFDLCYGSIICCSCGV